MTMRDGMFGSIHKLGYHFSLAIVVCLLNAGCTREPQEAASRQAGHPDYEDAYYLGYTPSGSLKRAWLFYVDKTKQTGRLYVPPKVLELKMQAAGPEQVMLIAKGEHEEISFAGTEKDGALEGEISTLQPTKGKTSTRMRAWKLPTEKATSTLVGRYSNVEFSEEGGDLIGVELVLGSLKPPYGLIVFYEGYWNEPTYFPFAVEELEQKSDGLYFRLSLPQSTGQYRLQIKDKKATFDRLDVQSAQGLSPIVLLKRPTMLPTEVD